MILNSRWFILLLLLLFFYINLSDIYIFQFGEMWKIWIATFKPPFVRQRLNSIGSTIIWQLACYAVYDRDTLKTLFPDYGSQNNFTWSFIFSSADELLSALSFEINLIQTNTLYTSLTPFWQLRSYRGCQWRTYAFPVSHQNWSKFSFQNHWLLFSHASKVRDEKSPQTGHTMR